MPTHAPLTPVQDIFQAMRTEQIGGHSLADVVGGGDPEWVAQEVVTAIKKFAYLTPKDSILDLGCGCGRIATALTQYIGQQSHYIGVDIVPGLIDFAKTFITPRYPHFKFFLLNESNTSYDFWRREGSEEGVKKLTDITDTHTVDLAICVSLLTHLDYEKALETLLFIRRALKNNGRAFVTLFVLDDFARKGIEKMTAYFHFNHATPSGKLYAERSDDPTFAVGYNQETLDELVASAGLQLERSVRGYWSVGASGESFQDALILRKASS